MVKWTQFPKRLTGVILALVVVLSGELFGQPATQYLRVRTDGCPNIQPLDFLDLLQTAGADGGKVTVRIFIDQNGSVQSRILESAERSGPPQFWNQVKQTLDTWCYSPGAVSGGHLDYTVVVNPRSEGGGGYVEISAKDLILSNGWALDLAHGDKLAYVQNIDLGDVMVTEAPPSIHAGGPKGFWGTTRAVIGHLGAGFQIAFAILLVLLIAAEFAVAIRGARSWVKPPLTLGFGKGRRAGEIKAEKRKKAKLDRQLAEKLASNFGSWEAMEIRERWIKAMSVSQLEPDVLPVVTEEDVAKTEELSGFVVKQAKSSADVYTRAKELGLVGNGRVFEEADFLVSPLPQKSERIEDLRNAVLEAAKQNLDMDRLIEAAQAIKAASSREDILRLAREYELPTEVDSGTESGHTQGSLKDLSELRKTVVERAEWAKLYLRHLQPGLPSLEPEEDRKLRLLTWEHFARKLVESAHQRASQLAEQGIDLFEVFEAGLGNHLVNRNEWWASQEIDRSVDRSLSVKLDARKSVLDSLWAIGAIAPLIGLFGTVWGISAAFGKIQNIQEAQLRMAKLSGDINVALSTTIVGLIIGIIAFLSYYWFKGRIEHMGAEVAKYFTDITNRA